MTNHINNSIGGAPDMPAAARCEWRTEDFSYVLPDERIADAPVSPRDMARLLHVKRDALADCTV
ncbi:MAG: S-adenosylmethionine:tRNA ribosyltransferase-isomerase, partial [Alphaproteobacteria bacterium]|nr:S-adenosylmethionine:tRNA ribosyltransferase-isomerase [Alphaproteobacteria bacterium]